MSSSAPLGQIVWHDLFTPDVEASKRFYGDLFGFEYVIEHSTDFVWGGGPGDYVLMSDGAAAHSGIIGTPENGRSGWLVYVAVDSVDEAALRASASGGTVARDPFHIPGVGRSCLVDDVHGAQIAPFVPSHSFPAPSGLFVWAELFTPDPVAVSPLYETMLGWRAHSPDHQAEGARRVFETPQGDRVAGLSQTGGQDGLPLGWVPFLAVASLDDAVDRAVSLGAQPLGGSVILGDGRSAQVLQDPVGAVFGVVSA